MYKNRIRKSKDAALGRSVSVSVPSTSAVAPQRTISTPAVIHHKDDDDEDIIRSSQEFAPTLSRTQISHRSRRLEDTTQSKRKKLRTQTSEIRQTGEVVRASSKIKTQQLHRRKSSDRRPAFVPRNYFELVLHKCGFIFKSEDQFHAIKKEQAIFIRDLKRAVLEHVDYPDNIAEFRSGFETVAKELPAFKKLLMGTLLQITENVNELAAMQSHYQDSVIRLILNIDILQKCALDVLFDKLEDFATEDEMSIEESRFVGLILKQLRFLDFVVDGESLANRLILLIEAGFLSIQQEITLCLPDLIADPQHDLVGLKLSNMMKDNYELIPCILDSLGNLSLNECLLQDVMKQVLDLLKAAPPLGLLHNIVKFLLAGCNDLETTNRTIKGLRSFLDWGPNTPERATCQVETLSAIRLFLLSSKSLGDAFLRTISNIKVHDEHSTLDFVILLLLHSTSPTRRRPVEILIRRRISSNLFRTPLLESTFKTYGAVLCVYQKQLLSIAELLIKDKNATVVDYGALCFKFAFLHLNGGRSLQQLVLGEIVRLCKSEGNASGPALALLTELKRTSGSLLQPHAMILLALLDGLDALSLIQTRLVMDLLCGLAYPPPPASPAISLQSDIIMLVRKQLSSHKTNIKRKGVVSCVMTVKHLAANYTEDNVGNDSVMSDTSYNSISALPEGAPKDAANLIELMMISTAMCQDSQGLCYDELAAMLSVHVNIDRKFLSWLCDAVTNDFLKYFVVKDVPEVIDDLQISEQYCINPSNDDDDDEEKENIIINIVQLVASIQRERKSILILAPKFRLLRVLNYLQFEGSLESINAVLGCAIAMPAIHNEDYIYDLPQNHQTIVVDSLFHCVNWFRECISAFVKQTDPDDKKKVLSRLRTLVKTETQIFKLMKEYGTDYKPPLCHFHAPEVVIDTHKVKKSPVKKKKKSPPVENTMALQITAGPSQLAPKTQTTKSFVSITYHQAIFRQLDASISLLLREPLNISDCETENELNLQELSFILQDLTNKLDTVIGLKRGEFDRPEEPPQLSIITPLSMITDLCNQMPYIIPHLDKISSKLKLLLDEGDGILDAITLLEENSLQCKECIELILKLLSMIFKWNGFQNNSNSNLLRATLNMLASPVTERHTELLSLKHLVMTASSKLKVYQPILLTMNSAVFFVKLLQTFLSFSDQTELKKQIRSVCNEFLTRQWFDERGLQEKGTQFNLNLDYLIKTYFKHMELSKVSQTLQWVKEESSMLAKKNDSLNTFRCINKTTFPLFYRGLYGALIEAVKDRVDRPLSKSQQLVFWGTVMKVLGGLMSIIKIQDVRTNLSTFLKKSQELLKLFINHGISGLESSLKSNSVEVTDILRDMQQTTRYLHSLCCHSKIIKDTGLMAHVPGMIETLESVIYNVKAALVANNLQDAFWMGNLKNRDLHGEEIMSQSTIPTDNSAAEEEPDEQLPEDESESDESEDEQQNGNAENDDNEADDLNSVSEVF